MANQPAPASERGCQVQTERVNGPMTIVFEPDNLHLCVGLHDRPSKRIRLPGQILERALLFDGQLAEVMYDVTRLDGEIVDCSVTMVNSATPMSGREFVAALDQLTEGMTRSEREALADSLDPKWRDR